MGNTVVRRSRGVHGGAGECTEELLFEIVSGGANSVDKNLRPVEGRAGIVLIVLSKHNLFMGLVLRQWR